MSIDEKNILECCRSAWEPLLGLSVRRREGAECVDGETRFGSYVRIKGAWNGAVLVEYPRSVARHADAVLFASDAESVSDDDLQHALNELTRLLGQELQKRLPESTRVSGGKPAAEGRDTPRLSEMRPIEAFELSCEGRVVSVTVLERDGEPDAD